MNAYRSQASSHRAAFLLAAVTMTLLSVVLAVVFTSAIAGVAHATVAARARIRRMLSGCLRCMRRL